MSKNFSLPRVPSSPVGEVYVWLTGLGLAVGLIMIVGLLTIIVSNGLETFWPKPAYAFTVKQENGASEVYYANIARETAHREQTGDAAPNKVEEYQIYTGSKEVYGQAFKYIRKENVLSLGREKDLMEMERLSGGKSLVRPLYLMTEGGEKIEAGSARFGSELKRLVHEGEEIREKIEDIEKGEIGTLNDELNDASRELKALTLSYDFRETSEGTFATERENPLEKESDPVGAKRKWEEKIKNLRSKYDLCIEQTAGLRKTEGLNFLFYQLGDGNVRKIATDQIVHYIEPNQLGFFGKIGVFLNRLWSFISENPREANMEGGVFPAIFGTFVMTVLMSLLVTPIGVIAAIYLREYARQGHLVNLVRICVNNLAGVPSIVFGIFGLGFFVYFVGGGIDQIFFSKKLAVSQSPTFGTSGILWASLTLSLMTLPVVIVATEEALAAVPRGLREAALACGASKWQMIQRVILPGALPGVLTGVILSMARGAGEVAPLMVTGVVKLAPDLPIDWHTPFIHLERKFMHLGFHIYDVGFQSPDSEAAKSMVFATTLLLIVLVMVMNMVAIIIRNKLRKKHQVSSF